MTEEKLFAMFFAAVVFVIGLPIVIFGGTPDLADAMICMISDFSAEQCERVISPKVEWVEETTTTVKKTGPR